MKLLIASAIDPQTIAELQAQHEVVTPDFKMPVPVLIEYLDGSRETHRMWVTREGGELEVSLRSAKVSSVVFNRGSAVLGRVKNETKN